MMNQLPAVDPIITVVLDQFLELTQIESSLCFAR